MKNKGEIKINEEALSTSTLGEVTIKKNKPLLLIFLIVFFIAIVYFLPDISKFLNNGENNTNAPSISKKEEEKENKDEKEEVLKYYYKDNLEIKSDYFLLKNIFYSEEELEFVLAFNEQEFDLAQHYYFIEIYSEDNTLISRIMLEALLLKEGFEKKYIYELSLPEVFYFKVRNIEQNEFPEYKINSDTNEKSELFCENKNKTIKYYFLKEELYALVDELNITGEDISYYEDKLLEEETPGKSYLLDREGLTFKTTINYNFYNNIYELLYFNKGEKPTVIKFITEASGFTCK